MYGPKVMEHFQSPRSPEGCGREIKELAEQCGFDVVHHSHSFEIRGRCPNCRLGAKKGEGKADS